MYVTQPQLVSNVRPYCRKLLELHEHIVELGRIECNVGLELSENDGVELEHGCSVVALERNDCSVVVLERNNVVLGLVDCIQYRLVLSAYNDVLLELRGVRLVQPYNEYLALQLLCIVRLSHEYRTFEHASVGWRQSCRNARLCRHYYVQRFRGCVDMLVHGDVDDVHVHTQQLEHMK